MSEGMCLYLDVTMQGIVSFLAMMLVSPSWIITVPLALHLAEFHWVCRNVLSTIVAAILAIVLGPIVVDYLFSVEAYRPVCPIDDSALYRRASSYFIWSGAFLACFAQLRLWPIPGASEWLKSIRTRNCRKT